MATERRIRMLTIAGVSDTKCPDKDQLTAYILGELSGSEQLDVAKHVRQCQICQHLAVVCRPPEPGMIAAWDEQAGAVITRPRPRSLLQRVLARLAAEEDPEVVFRAGAVFRADDDSSRTHHYIARTAVDITLTFAVSHGDSWRITGIVNRAGEPWVGARVRVTSDRRRVGVPQEIDAEGGFTVDELPPGHYTLYVEDDEVQVRTPPLALGIEG